MSKSVPNQNHAIITNAFKMPDDLRPKPSYTATEAIQILDQLITFANPPKKSFKPWKGKQFKL